MDAKNPITHGSMWKTKDGNIWEVIGIEPFGKVALFDRGRVWFSDTYQNLMRTRIANGDLTQIHRN